jgi:hypothetical protein
MLEKEADCSNAIAMSGWCPLWIMVGGVSQAWLYRYRLAPI